MRDALANPNNAKLMRDFQRQKAFERAPAIALPARERVEQYRVRGRGPRLVEDGGAWQVRIDGTARPLPAEAVGFAQWVVEREYFSWEAGRLAHSDEPEDAMRRTLDTVVAAGLVERL